MTTPLPARARWRVIGGAVSIVLVGLCLRSPITSLAAVLTDIRSDFDLSPSAAGLLTSLPVLCFGVGAALVTHLARRFGLNAVMTASLALLTAFVALRPFGGPVWLLVATAGVGVAITAGNVLLPVVVRRDFPKQEGKMMAAATSSIIGGAAIAAALTVPLWMWLGWRWALAAWALLMLAAAVAYPVFAGPEHRVREEAASTSMWRVPGAWAMAVFFGLNSGMMYASVHWLPTLLPDIAGASDSQAGMAASAFQIFGLAGALVVPIVFTRVFYRQALAVGISGLWFVYGAGLLLAPSWYPLWILSGALAQGGVYAMLLTLYVLRAADLAMVRDVSGMTQTVGYFISALVPVTVGALFDTTGGWEAGLGLLAVMALALTAITPAVASRKKLTAI